MRTIRKFFTLVRKYGIILAVTLPVFGEPVPKISMAVLDFETTDFPAPVAGKISELIRIEMVNTSGIIVIERNRIDKILKEQGLQAAGLTDKDNIVKVGNLLSANKILYGTVMKLGKKIIITGQEVDVEKGHIEYAHKEEIAGEDQ